MNVIIDELKRKFLSLDSLINQNSLDKDGVISQQNEIIDLLRKNRVYGLEKLREIEIDNLPAAVGVFTNRLNLAIGPSVKNLLVRNTSKGERFVFPLH